MEKLYLYLAGNPNSGKTETSAHLARTFGFAIFKPSDLIRKYASEHSLPLNERRDYIDAHLRMIEEHGEGYIAERALGVAGEKVVIDGERIQGNLNRLRTVLGVQVVGIALWCPIRIRYQRAMERRELRDKVSFQDFAKDEAEEYQNHNPPYTSVMTVMQMADHYVDASGPLAQTFEAVDVIVKSLVL